MLLTVTSELKALPVPGVQALLTENPSLAHWIFAMSNAVARTSAMPCALPLQAQFIVALLPNDSAVFRATLHSLAVVVVPLKVGSRIPHVPALAAIVGFKQVAGAVHWALVVHIVPEVTPAAKGPSPVDRTVAPGGATYISDSPSPVIDPSGLLPEQTSWRFPVFLMKYWIATGWPTPLTIAAEQPLVPSPLAVSKPTSVKAPPLQETCLSTWTPQQPNVAPSVAVTVGGVASGTLQVQLTVAVSGSLPGVAAMHSEGAVGSPVRLKPEEVVLAPPLVPLFEMGNTVVMPLLSFVLLSPMVQLARVIPLSLVFCAA